MGVVLAREAVDVAPEVDGRLRQVLVRVGTTVAPQQRLASLDTRAIEHRLRIERAALERARAQKVATSVEAERALEEHHRRLRLEGLVSEAEVRGSWYESEAAAARLRTAAASLAEAEARVAQLEAELERAQVLAPFGGRISRRYLDAGARVVPGTPIVHLISADLILARFAVPPDEDDLAVGTTVRVEISEPRLVVSGEVEHVAPEIDAASEMVFVEARLPAPSGAEQALASGAAARVSLTGSGSEPLPCL